MQGQFSVSKVEALAMESGILLAQGMKLSQIIVESDALLVASSVNGTYWPSDLRHLCLVELFYQLEGQSCE